nr:atherin-like [Aegilops tauschii subsp. strangulata]
MHVRAAAGPASPGCWPPPRAREVAAPGRLAGLALVAAAAAPWPQAPLAAPWPRPGRAAEPWPQAPLVAPWPRRGRAAAPLAGPRRPAPSTAPCVRTGLSRPPPLGRSGARVGNPSDPELMAGIVHKEFPELAQTGLNYLSWSSDCSALSPSSPVTYSER